MKVIGTLVGVDGNAFALLAHFHKLARSQGLPQPFIDGVLEDAKSGDYNHLVATLAANMEEPEHEDCDL